MQRRTKHVTSPQARDVACTLPKDAQLNHTRPPKSTDVSRGVQRRLKAATSATKYVVSVPITTQSPLLRHGRTCNNGRGTRPFPEHSTLLLGGHKITKRTWPLQQSTRHLYYVCHVSHINAQSTWRRLADAATSGGRSWTGKLHDLAQAK